MQLDRSAHLAYCLNVHPGESWAENRAALETHVMSVRDRVASGRPFGLGLRLSDRASRELSQPGELERLGEWLDRNGLYVFTVNGFPFGRFHGGPVKASVYAPDWTAPERLAYTVRLAEILARLVPEASGGSISTVPGSFKAWVDHPQKVEAIVANLARAALHLEMLSERCGRDLHLGLEPEPACFLETADETVTFFQNQLWVRGAALAAEWSGKGRSEAEAILRRRVGVCLDTCHVALQFEDLADTWTRYRAAGLRLSKVQISAALALPEGGDPEALRPFVEPVYLHQTHGLRSDGSVRRWVDLPEALAALPAESDLGEVRVHFHVPLHWPGSSGLASTRRGLDERFLRLLREGGPAHLELETYTFDVLPADLRQDTVAASIAAEWRWWTDRWVAQMLPE